MSASAPNGKVLFLASAALVQRHLVRLLPRNTLTEIKSTGISREARIYPRPSPAMRACRSSGGVCEPNSGCSAPRVGSRRVNKKDRHSLRVPIFFGDPYGNRTHAFAVRGRRLSRLTNGPFLQRCYYITFFLKMQYLFEKNFFFFASGHSKGAILALACSPWGENTLKHGDFCDNGQRINRTG